MSVNAWTGGDHYPGAQAEVIAPPSLAWDGCTTETPAKTFSDPIGGTVPAIGEAPWAALLAAGQLEILEAVGATPGIYEITTVDTDLQMTLDTDPGAGTAVKAHAIISGRNGLHDLARRLQCGWTDAKTDPIAAVPSTIIGGRLITEAATTVATIRPY